MTLPWERSIMDSVELIRSKLTMYLRSATFEYEWATWNYIRTDVKWLLICGSFVYNNHVTKAIANAMYTTMVSQLLLVRKLNTGNDIPFELIVDEAINSFTNTPLYTQLIEKYRILWKSARRIQVAWRSKRCSVYT